MRLSTPRSRRNTMLDDSAVNVADIPAMPAIDGTSLLRSLWLPLRMMPPATRNSSGSRKLKKAALGLRQNRRRSSRNSPQASETGDGAPSLTIGRLLGRVGRQLQVDVLEGRPRHAEPLQTSSLGERGPGQLVQQRGRIVGLALDEAAVAVSVADPVRRGAVVGAELLRFALDDDPPVLDDRHPVGQRLGLVEVVGGEQDRLAERFE